MYIIIPFLPIPLSHPGNAGDMLNIPFTILPKPGRLCLGLCAISFLESDKIRNDSAHYNIMCHTLLFVINFQSLDEVIVHSPPPPLSFF